MEENKNTSLIANIPRLQWACRRGMLELDVLLGNFLKEAYLDLSIEKKLQFIELLYCEDPLIYAWLMGSSPPPKGAHIAEIVEAIRQHANLRIPI